VEAKDVAFKTFKVTYDRESGYLGYKTNGDEFPLMCSKFDKLLLVFKDGRYKVIELPEKLFVGQDLIWCGPPERDRVFTLAYSTKEATWIKRFTFGGTILDKEYNLSPEPKSKVLFFEADTPETVYIKYRPAPYQRISQQIAKPSELAVKNARSRGNQVSIKEVGSINSKPPPQLGPERDPDAAAVRVISRGGRSRALNRHGPENLARRRGDAEEEAFHRGSGPRRLGVLARESFGSRRSCTPRLAEGPSTSRTG
jgi:topoisomerase-4 subunit A